jgi:PAS domain S-box-containing protein
MTGASVSRFSKLLQLLHNLSQIEDSERTIEEFLENMGAIFAPVTFIHANEEPREGVLSFPVFNSDYSFGYISPAGAEILSDEDRLIVQNAISLLAVVLVKQKLKLSENRQFEMMSNIGDVIVIIDGEGINRYKSPNVEKLFGWKPEELIGVNTLDNVHPEDLAAARKFMEYILVVPNRTGQIELRYRCKNGSYCFIKFTAVNLLDTPDIKGVLGNYHDITIRRDAENSLRASEESSRKTIKAIIEPKGDVQELSLGDVVDGEALQSMMDELYYITGIPGAVIDLSGNVIVACGWQDICTKFHRQHPETLKNCIECDTILSQGVPVGTFKAYHCKNNMWDVVTPIEIGGRHVGNVFIGQFFYDDEVLDYDLFRAQAHKYGFDEVEYLAALERVPRFSKETVDRAMAFYVKLAALIASLSYSAVNLSRALSQQELTMVKLRESEARFKSLHNASFGGIAIHDKCVILECNYALSAMFGCSVEELIGTNVLLLIPEKSRDWVLHHILHGDECTYEAIGLRKNGEEFPIRLEGRNIPYQGRSVRTVEFRDLTEFKIDEEERKSLQLQLHQAQKMESVGRLAGGVAHDFNNMIGVILGYVDMAKEQLDKTHPIFNNLEEICKAAERSADLTRQLLAFARKQVVTPKVLDLNKTIESMLKMVSRIIGEDIDLAWRPGIDIWPIKVDPSQIDQILVNLCVNARDAIGDTGKLTIETGTASFDEEYCMDRGSFIPGNFVLLAVSDNGCGMDKETLSNIFEPFFTTKGVDVGTGLGMSTVYGIVRQNGGFVNVYSEPGYGTTVKIYLARYSGSGEGAKAAAAVPSVGGKETILLVEDEPSIRRMTTITLQRLGYHVVVAETPMDAIDIVEDYGGKIDLVLTDVVMPGMNGKDLVTKLKSAYPELNCLFMSGYTANVISHHGVLDEGVAFLEKPFSRKTLADKVRSVINRGSR